MAYTVAYHNGENVFSSVSGDDISNLKSPGSEPPPLPPRRPVDLPPTLSRAPGSIPQRPTIVRSNISDGGFSCSQLLSSLPASSAKCQTPTSPGPQYYDTQTTPPPLPARRAPPLLPPPSRHHCDDVDSGFSTFSSSSSSSKRTIEPDGQSTKSSEGDGDEATKRTRKSFTLAAAGFQRQLVKIGRRMKGSETTPEQQMRRTSSDEPDHWSGGSSNGDVKMNDSVERPATEKFNYRQSLDDLRHKVATPISR